MPQRRIPGRLPLTTALIVALLGPWLPGPAPTWPGAAQAGLRAIGRAAPAATGAVGAALLEPAGTAAAQPAPAPSRVLVGTNGSGVVARGPSGGWTQKNVGHDLTAVPVALAPLGLANTVYIWGTTAGAVRKGYKSTDGGETWTQIGDTPGSTNYVGARPYEDTLYALNAGTVSKSAGGGSWAATALAPIAGEVVHGFGLPNVAGTTRIWFYRWGANSDGSNPGQPLHYTDDEGATWFGGFAAQLSPSPGSYVGISPDIGRTYLHYPDGTSKRFDLTSPTTATAVGAGVGIGSVPFISNTASHTVFHSNGGFLNNPPKGMYVSEDGGQTGTFAADFNPSAGFSYDPSAPKHWWLAVADFGSNTVASSTDDGATWTGEATGFAANLSLAVVGPAQVAEPPPAEMATSQAFFMQATPDPVETLTGNFTYARTDLAIAGRGPSPAFARAYNSADTRVGPLGPGWTHSSSTRIVDPGDASGDLVLVGPTGRSDRFAKQPDGSYTAPPASFASLVRNSGGTVTVTHKDRTTWLFDGQGRLIVVKDRHGNQAVLGYNGSGRLATVSDPAGRGSLTFTYGTSGGANGRLTKVEDWLSPARSVQFGYDAQGRLQTVTDREGKVTTYAYDGTSHRLTTITDALGHVAVTNSYDAQGRVQTQKDARGLVTGQQTTFSYVTNGDGTKTTTVTYPVTSSEPAWAFKQEDTYDTQGRITKRVSKPTSNAADDVTMEWTYDGASNWATVKDGRGNVATLCYDVGDNGATTAGNRRNLTRRIDPPPAAGGNRLVTLYTYDAKDNLLKVVPPKGVASTATTACTTDLSGAITTQYQTDYAYDGSQVKLLSVTRRYTDPDLGALTAVTKYEYDPAQPGLLSKVIPPRGNTGASPDYTFATSFAYFGTGTKHGLLQQVTDPLGNKTSYDYDAVGRRINMVDPLGNATGGVPAEHRWEYSYDKEDRPTFVKAPPPAAGGQQLITESRYDAVGNRTSLIDATGQVTRYLYDERDGLQEVWESPNAWTDPNVTPSPKFVTAYEYDHLGNLSRVTRAKADAPNERAVDYAYDGLNRLRKETQYPSWPTTTPTLVTEYTYDKNSNRATLKDPLNQTTTFAYDALNRLTGIDYSDPATPDVTYAYDANGNRTSMADGTGSTAYSYDELDRLTLGNPPGAADAVGYRYDRDGHRTKVIYPGTTGAVTYAFDKAGRLTGLTDWASRQVSYEYFADGALKKTTNPTANGTTVEYAYDNARRLTSVANKKSATTLTSHAFTLDKVGNRTVVDEVLAPLAPGSSGGTPNALPATRLTGSPAGAPNALPTTRLTGAPSGAPNALPAARPAPPATTTTQQQAYSYDKLYRLTGATLTEGGATIRATSYTYDPVGNRLTRVRGVTTNYSYDRADRITLAGGTGYVVNANGNLTGRGADTFAYDQANRLKQATVAGTTASYVWDGDGKRLSSTVGAATTTWIYDVNRGLPVVLQDGTRSYVWGLGLAYSVQGTTVDYYHADGLGSVRALTDGAGAVVQTYETDEFGVPTEVAGSRTQAFQYTGEQRDGESGLVYLRARMYEPQLGRFLQRDPVSGYKRSPASLHRYAYARANPCTLVDPTGLDPKEEPCGEGEVRLYRGTDRTAELAVFDATGHILSDAGIHAFVEEGYDLDTAYQAAQAAHQRALGHPVILYDELKLVALHAVLGTNYEASLGVKKTFISATTRLEAAEIFAGGYGMVLTGCFPVSELTLQPFGEVGEVLITLGTDRFRPLYDRR